jgi:hypothetical protein
LPFLFSIRRSSIIFIVFLTLATSVFDQVNGNAGAGQIAPLLEGQLQQNQETLDFLLDEGMFVMQVVSLHLPLPLTFFSTEPEFVNV